MKRTSVHNGESESGTQPDVLLCPSAQPQLSGSVIFATVGDSGEQPQVRFLKTPVRVTENNLVAFASSTVRPTEVFRFAAPCSRGACRNWSGHACRVAQRLVQITPADVSDLPSCSLRMHCRWFRQEGAAACSRCSLVVTDDLGFEAELNSRQEATDPVMRSQ